MCRCKNKVAPVPVIQTSNFCCLLRYGINPMCNVTFNGITGAKSYTPKPGYMFGFPGFM